MERDKYVAKKGFEHAMREKPMSNLVLTKKLKLLYFCLLQIKTLVQAIVFL